MARITVEDCLKKIPNRFQMVLAAAYRARQLSHGYAPKVDAKDKPAVVVSPASDFVDFDPLQTTEP